MILLPEDLERRIGPAEWIPITIGHSDAYVYRLVRPGKSDSYLKVIQKEGERTFSTEYDKLMWLQNKLPVPQVLDFRSAEGRELLWMSAVPGVHAADRSWESNIPHLVALLAQGLRQIHALDIADCPFDKRNVVRLREAELNVREGLVDEEDFDQQRLGRTAEDLYEEMIHTVPASEELVFTHGDYCLPNILIDTDRIGGFIDWGNAGAADRYQDLALAVRSITYNFGVEWVGLFLQEYGIYQLDQAKLEFYQLLDEFF